MAQFAGISTPRFSRGTSAGSFLNTGLRAIEAGGQQIAAGQAGTELDLLRKHIGDEQIAEKQRLARDRYNILKAGEDREAAKHLASSLLFDMPASTYEQKVDKVLSPMQQKEINLLQEQILGLRNQKDVPVTVPVEKEIPKTVIPVDTKATIPSYIGVNEEYAGTLPPQDIEGQIKKMSKDALWSNFLKDVKEGNTKAPEKPKPIDGSLLDLSPKTVKAEQPKSNKPKDLLVHIKEIEDKISTIEKSPAGTKTRNILKLPDINENAINKNLLSQFENTYGRKPTTVERASIGARAETEATNLRTQQAEAKKNDLLEKKTNANIAYMDAMADAARTKKSNSRLSKEMYKTTQKHADDWHKVRNSLVKADIGDADTRLGNKYLNLLEQAGISPRVGEGVIAAVGNQYFDQEVTADAIDEAAGNIQVYEPITKRFISLGTAIVDASDRGWQIAQDPITKRYTLIQEQK